MIDVCFLVWCFGQALIRSERITFTYQLPHDDRTIERVFAYERSWVVAGFMQQSDTSNAVFAGVLPITMTLFGGNVCLQGGTVFSSADVPRYGTHANFMASARVRLTSRVAIAYWHWSNANLTGSNPSVNALGVSLRLRGHGP
jgi:hypothetical protein